MSDFMDMFVEMLPLTSELQKKDNTFRKVIDKSMGSYMDNFEVPYDELSLTTATGGWLDAHGKDYGVVRKIDESDDDYRQRIIYEKLDNLTPYLLRDVYNVELFAYVEDYNPTDNTLTSDNDFINHNGYLGVTDNETKNILNKKFVVDKGITWL